ncbi:MAG: PIN domain-containing protein [Terrimesophilobacter sp.]
MFIAVLDSCVLWPSTLRDFLLSLAIEQLYTPAWSSAILEEVQYNEAEKLKGRPQYVTVEEADMRAARLVANMQSAFPDALTTGWEPLEGTFGLPDIDDEHILAAAVMAGAGAIVTDNRKDFPADNLPYGIEVLSPQDFARDTVSLNPYTALKAIRAITARSGRHGLALSEGALLNILQNRYHLTDAVSLLNEARST